MPNPVLQVLATRTDGNALYSFWMWCPGCEDAHRIVDGPDGWTWSGSTDRPTFTPSIKVTGVQWAVGVSFYKPTHGKIKPGAEIVCHSFLTDGIWNFLGDSTHALAGQQVPMVPVPDWLVA